METTYSRRNFIKDFSRFGGSAFLAMSALDLLGQDKGPTWLPKDLPKLTQSKKVIILGAGAAGLCTAYELTKLGYSCTVLEARLRPGGRIWTVRRGTKETEMSGGSQTCEFEPGHYMNAGPARIPQYHYTTLGYCREFNVPIEVFNNYNESAYVHNSKLGTKMRMREVRADYEGYTAELLAKAISQDKLEAPFTAEDREKLLDYLRVSCGLDAKNNYGANPNRGYTEWPAATGKPGVLSQPTPFEALLKTGLGAHLAFAKTHTQQPVMFQPVGGIDALPYAMAKQLNPLITYGAEVTALRKTPQGKARVEYRVDGADKMLEADYCICTLPAAVLANLPSDFSEDHKKAIGRIQYSALNKIGLQFKRRFWEEDDWIFGGMSWTDQTTRQIWYPNYGYLQKKGVIVGYYTGDLRSDDGAIHNITGMTHEQRLEHALSTGEMIHPQYRREFENSFSVSWKALKYNLGATTHYETAEMRTEILKVIGEGDGPLYIAGEHASWITGWIAGAFESALHTVKNLHQRALA